LANSKKKIMATNKPVGDNARKGAVKQRSQVLNPKTNLYVKRDTETGKFMDVKTTGGKFKGVTNENKN
jgi:hypothetical protein